MYFAARNLIQYSQKLCCIIVYFLSIFQTIKRESDSPMTFKPEAIYEVPVHVMLHHSKNQSIAEFFTQDVYPHSKDLHLSDSCHSSVARCVPFSFV